MNLWLCSLWVHSNLLPSSYMTAEVTGKFTVWMQAMENKRIYSYIHFVFRMKIRITVIGLIDFAEVILVQ